jgi:deoxyadenosine/deoxycytidine kinase
MYVAVSGNIATGKTTFSHILRDAFGFYLIEEDTKNNQFLNDFYFDMPRWAFHSQLAFMAARSEQIARNITRRERIAIDRSISEDFYVFAAALHEFKCLESRELELLEKVFHLVTTQTPAPDIYFYLYDDLEKIYERILLRGTPYESKIEKGYLSVLQKKYEFWKSRIPSSRIVALKTSDLDFRTIQGKDRAKEMIKQALQSVNP